MLLGEAFRKLGYDLVAIRTDWSAANADGVCVSLWTKETDWTALVMDSREHAGDLEDWQNKQGNRRRIEHAALAIEKFDGWVDVVKIEGIPGESYGSAYPWNPVDRRSTKWRVTFLDKQSGHLRLEAQKWPGSHAGR